MLVRTRTLILLSSLLAVAPLGAQQTPGLTPADSVFAVLAGAQRTKISRAQLEANLATIEQVLASPGYSGALKEARRAEAALIRRRLEEGDLNAGDAIAVQVLGDMRMTQIYYVTPRRTILIPGISEEVSVAGLLRSELEPYLTAEIGKYVRNATVRVEPLLRISIFGAVGRAGFFLVAASKPLPDILMDQAGGPAPNAEPKRGAVYRGDREVLPGEALEEAIREARTIDALNLQAGDRIEIGAKPSRSLVGTIFGGLGAVAGLVFVITRTF